MGESYEDFVKRIESSEKISDNDQDIILGMMKMTYVTEDKSMKEIWKEFMNEEKIDKFISTDTYSTFVDMVEIIGSLFNTRGIKTSDEQFLIKKLKKYTRIMETKLKEEDDYAN